MPTQPEWWLAANDVARVMGGELRAGRPDDEVGPVSIDSRSLEAGDLFFAIRGDRFDGHEFAGQAIEAGAKGVVVSDAASLGGLAGRSQIVIVVRDTVQALQQLARHVRHESGARVVAITGSTGKTSTKEIVFEFLSLRYQTVRNRDNLNNHIGLPLSLMALRHRPQLAVMELGMSHRGEIAQLVAIAQPDVCVWTNVGQAHVGFFESSDDLADAKAEIMQGADTHSLLVANADDGAIMRRTRLFPGRVVTFGLKQSADVSAASIDDLGVKGTAAVIGTPVGQVEINVPLLGRGQLANVLAAVTVALQFQVPLEAIVKRAAVLRLPARRGDVVRLRDDIVVIDDSYNSSPMALEATLEVVRVERPSGRKIAVLGEMLELGSHARDLHRRCGAVAAACGLDLLVTVGGDAAREMADAAVRAGLDAGAVRHTATSEQAAEDVASTVRAGDLVLVKGSRGVRTDIVVARLTSDLA